MVRTDNSRGEIFIRVKVEELAGSVEPGTSSLFIYCAQLAAVDKQIKKHFRPTLSPSLTLSFMLVALSPSVQPAWKGLTVRDKFYYPGHGSVFGAANFGAFSTLSC